MGNVKLLPCPFCGGQARISSDTEATRDANGRLWAFTIVCDSCCATSGLCYSSEMAEKSWNNRKPMEQIIQQLEKEQEELETDMWARENDNWYGQHCNGRSEGIDDAIDAIKQHELIGE